MKSLINTSKITLPKTILPMKNNENNFVDSLMTELRSNKFATVPVRRQRSRPGLFDNSNRDAN